MSDAKNEAGASSSRDVRMRGFASRSTVQQAWDWVDGNCHSLESEVVPLERATGRVLAAGVISDIDVPPFDRAAMDGFAILAHETMGASDYNPLPFNVIGDARPGREFEGKVVSGTTVRITTGAPMPQGADAVVPAEYARDSGDSVELTTSVPTEKHIGRQGEDVKQGAVVLSKGHRLRPQDAGVIAAIGRAGVTVVRRPRVRLLLTGNELVSPGNERQPHQIYEANSYLLRGLIDRDGGELVEVVRLQDDRESIAAALQAPGADVILISGGSSVGAEDYAPILVAELGTLAIHGIAMRPSSPAGMGTIGGAQVFLLPGNPVSCLCAYDFFAGRAIRLLGGRSKEWPYQMVTLPLARKIASSVGRVDYCRVKVTEEAVEPIALSGASILSSAVRADGFVIVPENSEGAAAGTLVDVYLWSK
ncbi:MAG: molybdopterin molybdotransferase MoeA [Planctomycetaceae bacterium]